MTEREEFRFPMGGADRETDVVQVCIAALAMLDDAERMRVADYLSTRYGRLGLVSLSVHSWQGNGR